MDYKGIQPGMAAQPVLSLFWCLGNMSVGVFAMLILASNVYHDKDGHTLHSNLSPKYMHVSVTMLAVLSSPSETFTSFSSPLFNACFGLTRIMYIHHV
jgi:hypothetical protein